MYILLGLNLILIFNDILLQVYVWLGFSCSFNILWLKFFNYVWLKLLCIYYSIWLDFFNSFKLSWLVYKAIVSASSWNKGMSVSNTSFELTIG